MLILGCIFGGVSCLAGVAILWVTTADQRFARREEKRRQRLIDQMLRRAER